VVSTRIVIALAVFIVFLGMGSGWITYGEKAYTLFDVVGAIGSTYGPCNCPPTSNPDDGRFWQLLLPSLVAPGGFAASLLTYPLGLVLGAVSIFRWKLMVFAGLFSLASGLLWLLALNTFEASQPQVFNAVVPPIGPYQVAVGGIILMAGYFLSKAEMLDYPID
jgi:hypothetical protein